MQSSFDMGSALFLLDGPPPCPECGGDLVETRHEPIDDYPEGWTYRCPAHGCGWEAPDAGARLTTATAPWTRRLAATLRAAVEHIYEIEKGEAWQCEMNRRMEARAEKAERERDELRTFADLQKRKRESVQQERDEARAERDHARNVIRAIIESAQACGIAIKDGPDDNTTLARLVAGLWGMVGELEVERDEARASLSSLDHRYDLLAARLIEAETEAAQMEAERDRLRVHAEAMANAFDPSYSPTPVGVRCMRDAVAAYRATKPAEPQP
jgi:hypothetical protein